MDEKKDLDSIEENIKFIEENIRVFQVSIEKAREYLNEADDVSPILAFSALRACVSKCVEALETISRLMKT